MQQTELDTTASDTFRPGPETIRSARSKNPELRERDFASRLGISEAEYVAAWCGDSVTRISASPREILPRLESLGEVMALTRNESAVHEKIGVYDSVRVHERGVIVVGKEIDLRIREGDWVHAFAVEKHGEKGISRSLQIFNRNGDAVHKVHLRETSDLDAWQSLVDDLTSNDQSRSMNVEPNAEPEATASNLDGDELGLLHDKWAAMKDVHQFMGILRTFNISRHQAVSIISEDFAWQLDNDALKTMMFGCAETEQPLMCFVGNPGVIQIHSGPIRTLKEMGPWINVMDPDFHLHFRLDHIDEVWAVRKPTKDGHVTSLEVYDGGKNLIIQFFGLRHEGETERPDWRSLIESLPRAARHDAA